MKKVILASSTALGLIWAAPALSQAQLPALLEGVEAMAGQNDTRIAYDNKKVGDDYSVEYSGLRIEEDAENGTVIEIDWLRIEPSASVPGQVTISVSPRVNVTINENDIPPYTIEVLSDGVTATLDNIIPGAGGDAAATWNYVLNIPSLQLTGSGDNPIFNELSFAITGLTTMSSFTPASMTVASEGGWDAFIFAFDVNTYDGQRVAESGNMVDFAYDLAFDAVDERQMPDYMKGERNASFNFTAGSQSIEMAISGPDVTVDMTAQSVETDLSATMTDGIFAFNSRNGVANYQFNELVIEGTPVPPFMIALTSADMGLRLPLINSGDVEEASLKLSLENLTMPESLLAMIDPGQSIPRTPLNLNIDVLANVISRINWDNPDSSFDSGNPMDVVEVQDITIRQILLAAGGAEVSATGDATVDNSMGFPFPTGMVTITAKGVQTLVNALVQIGLVPQQQAGMAMGMIMGFARAEGADHYVSDIEFSPNGVTANGNALPF